MKNKKVTIEGLAVIVKNGFSEVSKNNEDLAAMVQNGFYESEKKTGERFDRVEKRLDDLEHGQEEIKLKLDNVAYRFELVELQRRVEILEKKLSLKRS